MSSSSAFASLFAMPPNQLIGGAAIIAVAAIIRGLTGFGFAILAVPLLGLLIPPAQAVLLAIILQMLIGPVGIKNAWPQIDRRSVLSIGAVAMLSTPAGLWLLFALPQGVARLLIAAIAVGCFLIFLLKRSPLPSPKPLMLALTGLGSGVLNGFAAMPGPPVILHFVRDGVPRYIARASMITIFFGTGVAGTLTAAARGLITVQLAALALVSFPIMLIGNRIGSHYFGTLPDRVWRMIVLALLVAAALGALAKLG